jgi:putative transposase
MARLSRVVVPGFPHHVTQRGNRRAIVFDNDEHRHLYLELFDRYRRKHGLEVWAYCLMPNHVHWVVVPKTDVSLARTFRDTHTVYAAQVNHARGENGHLWQGRFFSCPLDETHLWAAVRYVEQNAVRAKLVGTAEEYPWSSAPAHCGKCRNELLAADFPPVGVVGDWCQWLKTEDAAQLDALRRQTHVGRPCGSESFMGRVEALLGRILTPQKAGRKKKSGTPKVSGV